MINYENNTIQIGAKEHPIVSYEVWFRIPTGLTSSREIAVARCNELDFNPQTMIVAIPVAVASDQIYEELNR